MKFFFSLLLSYSVLSAGQPVFMQHAASGIHDAMVKMSLRDKIAQMMMIRVGLISTDQERKDAHELVEKYHVGGIFLATTPKLGAGVDEEMRQTSCTMAKAKELIDSLQAASGNSLLVGMDCEWGTAMRLVDGIQIPYNMALAGIQDLEKLRQVGAIVGQQSMQLGIHCLGVVVDVNSNPENPVIGVRSFGGDPEQVSKCALAMIAGMQDAGCIVAAKHFCGHQDGHGNTTDDSHCMLPLVEDIQVLPATTFQDAINAGVDAIMTAHVDVRCLTKAEREEQNKSELSATMSHAIITDLLKDEMHFRGLVMTDALDMLGVATYYTPWEAAAQAVIAGNDIVLFPLELPQCIDYIEQKVLDGTIDVALIDRAVTKILQAKYCVKSQVQRNGVLDQEEVQSFVRQLYRDTMAFTEYGDATTMPIIPESVRYVVCGSVPEYIQQNIVDWITFEQSKSADNDDELHRMYIIALPSRGKLSTQAKELVRQVREQMMEHSGSLAVILGNPYAVYELADVGPVLVGFDTHPLAQQAIVDILQGCETPTALFPIRK